MLQHGPVSVSSLHSEATLQCQQLHCFVYKIVSFSHMGVFHVYGEGMLLFPTVPCSICSLCSGGCGTMATVFHQDVVIDSPLVLEASSQSWVTAADVPLVLMCCPC